MRTWAQKEINDVVADNHGVKHFPPGRSFGDGRSFGANCSFGECCSFNKGCKADSIYWGFIYRPSHIKVKGRIYPPPSSRRHWAERLKPFGIKYTGCYEEIFNKLKKRKEIVLTSKQWTKCELWILKSWLR